MDVLNYNQDKWQMAYFFPVSHQFKSFFSLLSFGMIYIAFLLPTWHEEYEAPKMKLSGKLLRLRSKFH